jgi:nitroimidazol reductase NimA-like FMN-containing flavoprotein (pyridoxamine 5'-phosphate oxidase superfamily)
MATTTPGERGDGQLTPAEVAALLDGPMVARAAFVTPECAPYVVPLWQEWDGQAMWFIVRQRSAFVAYLRHNPRMAVSCARDGDGNPRVLLEGTGEIVAGPEPLAGAMLAMAERMAERYMGPRGPEYVRRTTDRPRYWLTLTPTRLTSWRGAEWAAKYRR